MWLILPLTHQIRRNLLINISFMAAWPLIAAIVVMPVLDDARMATLLFDAASIAVVVASMGLLGIKGGLLALHVLFFLLWLCLAFLPVVAQGFYQNKSWLGYFLCSIYAFLQSTVSILLIWGAKF